VMSQAQFSDNTVGIFKRYQQIGAEQFSYDVLEVQQLNCALSLASIKWHFKKADNSPIYAATTRYLVCNQSDQLQIKAVFVVDEVSQWKKLMA